MGRPSGLLLGSCVLLLAGLCPAGANYFAGDQKQVVQFGTFDVALQQCFFGRIFAGMISPQTLSFSNPAAKAIAFITVEMDQGSDFGGITATITSGTIETSTTITLQVTTAPVSISFPSNVDVQMFCKK